MVYSFEMGPHILRNKFIFEETWLFIIERKKNSWILPNQINWDLELETKIDVIYISHKQKKVLQ